MLLVIAALLTVGLGLAHSFLGEWKLIGPLLDPARRVGVLASSSFARNVLRFAWHLTSLAWWGFAAILIAVAASPNPIRDMLWIIATTFALTGLLILIVGRGRHLAWPVCLTIAALAVWGTV